MSTVMVVDDSDFDRELLRKILEKKGNFKVIEASSGIQCLEVLSNESVDLVLLDILMPDSSGVETLLKIRERFNGIGLPVIMVTSKTDASDVIQCLKNGANDYITKPVNLEVAFSRITTHLSLARASKETANLKELAALNAMIVTYNHELNSPLAVALACMSRKDFESQEVRDKVKTSLHRMAEILKKIRDLSQSEKVNYEAYAGETKMVKLG